MNSQEHIDQVDLKWAEGRIGILSSPVLDDRIEVATPPQYLFVSSVSSCFMNTFTAIAENSKLSFESLDVKAEGKMDKKDGKFMITEIVLKSELMISDEQHSEKTLRIMEKAEAPV